MNLEYITLCAYFALLLALGYGFSKLTKNMSDFVQGGAQGTWWLVGSSILMSGISAFTFTGNGSAAFEAGPTFLIIYVANCLGYFISWLFLATWFRQTRAYTVADILRARFGTAVEQFSVYSGLFLGPLISAVQLWALALFTSAVFDFPLTSTIIVIGIIVVIYSTMGGKWAVMATDFVQCVVMYVITIVMAVLAIIHIGGLGAFFSYFSDPRFVEDFKLIKERGEFSNDRFTLKWVIVIFFMQFYSQISLATGGRFLAAKDGREARKAACFALVLMAFGSLVWFLPPMVARFMYGEEILAQGIKNPAETAYAFLAIKILPNGLLGILIAAMFAATMSSMDSGLNSQAGTIVRNLVPRLRSALGLNPELSNRAQMLVCYISSVALGAFIIFAATLFSMQKEIVLFDAFLTIGSIIGIPLGFPLLMGLWVKRIPSWSYFVIFAACLVPSLISFHDGQVNNNLWTIQDRSMWIFITGSIATVGCVFCYRFVGQAERDRIITFFRQMRTPVDFAKEIGTSSDHIQAKLVGDRTAFIGAIMFLLLLLSNDLTGRLWIAGVAGSMTAIGVALMVYARRLTRAHNTASPKTKIPERGAPAQSAEPKN